MSGCPLDSTVPRQNIIENNDDNDVSWGNGLRCENSILTGWSLLWKTGYGWNALRHTRCLIPPKLRQNSSDSCIVYKLHCLGLSQTQLTKPFLDVLHNCKTINKSGVPLSELPMRVEHLQHIHHVRPRSHGAPIASAKEPLPAASQERRRNSGWSSTASGRSKPAGGGPRKRYGHHALWGTIEYDRL